MVILFIILVFTLGLCLGSFVNMLVYRTAKKYGILKNKKINILNKNRSFCDFCGKQLKWYENVPILSWIIQKGKTRCCGKNLPILYPIIELMMGILFVIYFSIGKLQGSPLQCGLGLLIIVLLVFSAVFDWKYMILPDVVTILLIISALVFWFLGHFGEWNYFLVALASMGFLLILNLITKGKGMGIGDVKFAFFMGLFLGYPKVVIAFYVAFIVGALVSLVLLVFKKIKRKAQIPFGPFLILGTLVAWIWGNSIWHLVFGI
ncbi:MAG: prepilin peptidase [Candidatus Shapirobacteria bacterium]